MAGKQAASHRRKGRANVPKNSPFPIPISTLTQLRSKQDYWFYYTGNLKEDHVQVSHSGDIHFLYTMGFFGRGLLSRGAPELHDNFPNVHIPTSDGGTDVLRVMRRRMYLRHKQWQRADGSTDGTIPSTEPEDLAEFDSDVDYTDNTGTQELLAMAETVESDLYTEQYEVGDVSNITWNCDQEEPANTEIDIGMDKPAIQYSQPFHDDGPDKESLDDSEPDGDFWEDSPSNEKNKTIVDEWENKEADYDFWGNDTHKTTGTADRTEDTSDRLCGNKDRTQTEDISDRPRDNKNMTQTEDISDRSGDNKDRTEDSTDKNATNQDRTLKLHSVDPVHDQYNNNSEGYDIGSGSENNDNKTVTNKQVVDGPQEEDSMCPPLKKLKTSTGEKVTNAPNDIERFELNVDVMKQNDVQEMGLGNHQDNNQLSRNAQQTENAEVDLTDTCSSQPESQDVQNTDINNEHKLNNYQMDMDTNENDVHVPEGPPYHHCCLDEDLEGDYLVIDDSDCDDRLANVQINNSLSWQPVRKADVYPYFEPLMLSLEEAFFLSYGLGCLTVRDESNSAMSLPDMWCQFCQQKQRFLPCYVAYHYFRSKGWVPRSGVTFGVDYILYRVGPPFYHSSYSVMVKTVYEGDYQEVAEFANRQLTWTSFAGLNRVTEHVAKTLMICYVTMPRGLTTEEMQSPLCLVKFKIKLQLVNRWVSSQEREKDKDLEEMP